ncbi:GIY-YIG nuclease family protein [Bacteroides nordii]
MANSNSNFIEFLSQNDPLGLLKVNTPVKPKAVRSILLSNFEEIVNFFEENNREPQHASTDIKEFQLYCRLKAIRESAEMVKELKDFDFYGLLSGSNISNITFDDIIGNDPLNLLGGDFNEEIFSLNHVKQTERISPEYISRRKFCRDFDKYQPMFEALQKDLEEGTRKLAVYHPEDLGPGNFYVLGGIILYLESVDGNISTYKYNSGERRRFDGRTVCIFDNGTTSDMLFRSLDKALQKDGYSVTKFEEPIAAEKQIDERDEAGGYVYVLKSRHAKLRNIPDVYKIGSTNSSVTERIKNATKEPTYLYAGVDIVETYRCFNIGARELEDRLHSFFDEVRLNINIPDERGVIISPREWFCVNLSVISEAVDKIISGTISNYIYDPHSRSIISKSTMCLQQKNIPMSDDDIYTDVIKILNQIGVGMERKPALYLGKDEEGLRDTLLTTLESRYNAVSATGETFNHGGKTDILLKDTKDGHNIFIGECKFWHGKKHFGNAIDQLFDRYLTWRDTKTALIIFVKGNNLTSVIDTVKKNIVFHKYYVSENGNHGDTSFSYIFRHPNDSKKTVCLEIMLFNFDKLDKVIDKN